MQPEQIISEIKKMSVSQKLLMAQDIWDSIAMESGNLPMPAWQKDKLAKRYSEYKNGKVSLHDWREVHARLREI
ncbi:MAG: addiction module protein [Desulfobacterales bacterium CG23_combo_of_CG06-09_8_20_14_all_51_8]|nr:MAG: addiction module protein [Desulfobacterales bacterium CG23_combo_of_CG06-09_8_20_14_all_51_8]